MKRINIHFDSNVLKELDEIVQKVKRGLNGTGRLWNITRADLIRLAVAKVYGLKFTSSHTWEDSLLAVLKKIKHLKVKIK